MDKIRINLASRPLRNTRFYRACLIGLAFLLVILAFLAGFFFIKYGFKDRRARSSLRTVGTKMQQVRAEETRCVPEPASDEIRLKTRGGGAGPSMSIDPTTPIARRAAKGFEGLKSW